MAVLAGGTAWWAGARSRTRRPAAGGGRGPATAGAPADAYRAVLDAEGWTVGDVYDDAKQDTGDIGCNRTVASLEVDWYPATGYDSRCDDRRRITDPPSDGSPVDLLRLPSSTWAYSAETTR